MFTGVVQERRRRQMRQLFVSAREIPQSETLVRKTSTHLSGHAAKRDSNVQSDLWHGRLRFERNSSMTPLRSQGYEEFNHWLAWHRNIASSRTDRAVHRKAEVLVQGQPHVGNSTTSRRS